MSDICSASAGILALSDADVLDIGLRSQYKRRQRGTEFRKRLLEKVVDIRLECEFSFSEFNKGYLVVKDWRGASALCGCCDFCRMLVDGFERGCRSELSRRDDLSVGLTTSIGLNIVAKKLEYHKDANLWADSEESSRTRNIHLAIFRATATIPSDVQEFEKPKPIPLDVAFELFGREDDPISTALRISRRPLEQSPLSATNVDKIQKWMRDCDENHDKCLKDAQLDYLPTRLLDVGTLECGKDPKLILSNETFSSNESKPKYMALSYCWGVPEDPRGLLTTTQDTLAARLSGIKLTSMPQVFKDAVQTARVFDIRYIWIDSLCIIQDDEDDWKSESGRMAETFSAAYLTVVAASSDSCHEGFLQREERPSCSVPLTLTGPSPGPSSIEGSYSLRYRQPHWGGDKMAEIKRGRWIGRGWTFQEERLARRALIFGEGKFFLDCRTLERIEDTVLYKHRPDWIKTVQDSAHEEEIGPLKRSNTGSAYIHRRTAFDHWRTLCSHYSRRDLTHEKDKLPAISGMARQILKKEGMGSEYLAGLWRKNLLHDLFWQPVNVGRKPKVYRAPTWSWASIDGHISWPTWRYCVEGECGIYCEILDAWTTVHSLDPFGAVTSGSLQMHGELIEVEMAYIGAEPASKQGPWSLTYEGKLVATGRMDTASSGELGKDKCWALLAAKCKVKEGRPAVPRGLLLEKSMCEDGTDKFERVGIFSVAANDREGSSPLEAWDFAGKQTITIL